eukprot:gene7117-7921_t
MNGFKGNGYVGKRNNWSKGVAAGFEGDYSSEDEFFFGDEQAEAKTASARIPPCDDRGKSTSNSVSPPEVQAPWLKNRTMKQSSAVVRSQQNMESDVSYGSGYAETRGSKGVMTMQGEDIKVAIMKGDASFIKQSLDSGFAVDTKIRSGWTALMYASLNGNAEIVKLLLSAGANVNFQKDLFTPLMALCTSTIKDEDKLLECANSLLSTGAKVDAHDRHMMTPIMYAAKNGRPNLTKLLIENQALIDYQDTQGWTALAFAASSGHTHVVRVLLSGNANENLCAYDGQSAADLAYASGYSTLADILENASGRKENNLQDLDHARSSKDVNSSKESKYYTYGDLELFLYGLELGHLVKIFRAHQLTFQDFLKITDEELTTIGICELGVKRKILDAIRGVHANEWDLAGLSVDKKSKINTLEAAAIMANVIKHLTCIQSSVTYLQNYVTDNKENISKDDPSLQKILVEQCKDGLKVCNRLKSNVNSLQAYTAKEFPRANETPCDLIEIRQPVKKKSNGKRILFAVAVVSVIGLSVAYGQKVVDRIQTAIVASAERFMDDFVDNFSDSDAIESCQTVANKIRKSGLIGAYTPSCKPNGDYSALQCHSSTGVCWCADRFGKPVSEDKKKLTDCSNPCFKRILDNPPPTILLQGVPTSLNIETFPPNCDANGFFAPKQCNTKNCWCVNKMGQHLGKKQPAFQNMKC